jgi:CPA1 family monovalent cation:H+ antiporter
MHAVENGILLIVVVAAGTVAARRLRLEPSILLVLIGVVLSLLPGVPAFHLDPQIVLVLILPPLLYAAAFKTSVPAFRANLRPILVLAVGLTLCSTLVVGLVAHQVVPGLPLAAAFALGAVLAPPDAVSATAVARRTGLPRRIVTVLEGESLLNDATALVAYRVAVAAAVSGAFSPAEVTWRFALASVGGAAVGLAVALVVGWLRQRVDDPIIDNTMSLVAPFAAYLPAEAIGASGVLAVVVTGLYLGHQAPLTMTAASRLVTDSVWKVIEFLLQGVVFTLIGLQLREVLAGLRGYDPVEVAVAALAVTGAVIGVRFAWMFPAAYGTRLLARSRDESPPRSWREPVVVSWAGMRGVVSLAAAFALPLVVRSGAAFPQRDLLLFLTFVVIGVTLVGQGATMPALIRRLRLAGPDPTTDALQEASAQHQAASAALERLEALLRSEPVPPGVAEQLRQRAEGRTLAAWERLGSPTTGSQGFPTPSAAYRRLRREMLAAEREVLVRLRDDGRLDQEVQRKIQRELDLEEATLLRD